MDGIAGRGESRGQPRWKPAPRPVELVLPEGTTGGQGRRRSPQARLDSAAEITSTPTGARRSGGDRLKTAPPPGEPRSHQGKPGGPVRDRIKDGAARRSIFGGFVADGGQPARASRLGRPVGRDWHPGVSTPAGRRSVNEPGGPSGTRAPPLDFAAMATPPHPDPIDRARPIPPAEQPARLAALVAAVRARSDLVPRVGIVLGSGLGGLADAVEDAGCDPVRGAARLARRHRAGPRRSPAPGPARRRARRRASGSLPPLRGQRCRPRGAAGAALPAAGRRARGPHQRRRRCEPVLRARHAHGHHGPPEPDRTLAARWARTPTSSARGSPT